MNLEKIKEKQIMGKNKNLEQVLTGKIVPVILSLFYIVQIIPILYLGQFNHPTSDDFKYGMASHNTWLETGSVVQTVKAAVAGVMEDYQTWQGSFSALFFMRLEPTVFGEGWYAIVPYLMIGLLTVGTLYFMRTLFRDVLKSDSLHWISISMLVLMLSVQFSPVASEQFFWFNSSIYYNAYHAFMLLYLAWLIRFIDKAQIRYIVYMAIFGVILGGGNYVTALTLAMIVATMIVWLIWIRPQGWKCKAVIAGVLWVEFLVCFLFSAIAPGNAVRAGSVAGYGAVKSIISSLIQGCNYYGAWLNKWWALVALLMLPILIGLIKKTTFKFSYPILVLLFSYGIFCAMSCPTFYALGSTGPGRIINIIYDAFLLVTYLQLFYVTGYMVRKIETMEVLRDEKKLGSFVYKCGIALALMWMIVLLISGSFLDTTTITACKVWIKGEAKQYDLEYKQRLAVLEDDSVSDVVFQGYSVEPELVFIADGIEDPNFVNNREWADFYGKNSLTIVQGEEGN